MKIDSGVRRVTSCLFGSSMCVMKGVKVGMRRMGVRVLEEEREGRLLDLSYADELDLWGESEENLRVRMGRFVD